MTVSCAKIVVSGYVQGVGYRYFTEEIAVSLDIKGWVRNASGGTVEVLAEGNKEDVDEFIEKLKMGPQGAVVRNVEVEYLKEIQESRDFRITH